MHFSKLHFSDIGICSLREFNYCCKLKKPLFIEPVQYQFQIDLKISRKVYLLHLACQNRIYKLLAILIYSRTKEIISLSLYLYKKADEPIDVILFHYVKIGFFISNLELQKFSILTFQRLWYHTTQKSFRETNEHMSMRRVKKHIQKIIGNLFSVDFTTKKALFILSLVVHNNFYCFDILVEMIKCVYIYKVYV